MTALQKSLSNTKGRFVTLNVNRVKSGTTSYSAKIKSVSDKTVSFWNSSTKSVMRAPLANVTLA